MKMKRVLLAGLFHETNTFLPGVMGLGDFRERRGEEMRAAEGDGSPLGGVLEVGRERDWEVLLLIDMRATPGATVADAVIERFWEGFQEGAAREVGQGIDGIYLVLHGAMVSESWPDVEGEILRRVRGLPGCSDDVPLCGVLDLHGNFTPAMAEHSSALVVYRENPHTDACARAQDAAYLLDRLMRTGERPMTMREQPPLLWPPTGTGTGSDPMRALEAMAREIEAAREEILAVNVFAGFPFADVLEAGVCFSAVTVGDPEAARAELRRLSDLALSRKGEGVPPLVPLDAAIRALRGHERGPALLVEPADNIGAGAPGDCTVVLRALVENAVENAGVILCDPESVRALAGKHRGKSRFLRIGGRSGAPGAAPIPLTVELVSRSDGRFTLEDRHSHMASMHGEHIDMGPCAVVRHRGIHILLTSRRVAPFDLGQWRSQGIAPESLSVINVKAAVAHRRAYDPIAAASYTLDTPGPCAENLRTLPFRHVRRPVFPLDEI